MQIKIKLLISFLLLYLYLFADISFASTAGLGLGDMGDILVKVVDFLSWFWVIPAILAGKLMSNDIVYGSAINLDVYLWQIWNMMKNFANFTLGFLFLFLILKTFFKGEPGSVVKEYLPKIVIAGVLIQATWFMMGAMVDLANIATAGVGSLSTNFFDAKDIGGEGEVKAKIPANCIVNRDINDVDKISNICGASEEGTHTVEIGSSDLLPSHDDFSGPLLYFGYSVFQFHKFNLLGNQTDLGDVVITVMIKAILILMFVVPIIVLFIANLLRVFWIWIWVMLSPFIVLDAIFGGPMSQKMNQFKISNIIGLIFQPVAVIATLSLALIIAVQFENILAVDKEKDPQVKCEGGKGICMDNFALSSKNEDSSVLKAGKSSFTMKGDLVEAKNKLGGGIGRIIEMIFLVFILRGLVRVGFKTSEITGKISDSIFNFAQSMAKTAPVIPTGQGAIGVGGAEKLAKRATNEFSKSGQVEKGEEIASYFGKNVLGMEGNTLTEGSLTNGTGDLGTVAGGNEFGKNLKEHITDESVFGEPQLQKELHKYLKEGGLSFLKSRGVVSQYNIDDFSTFEKFQKEINSPSNNDEMQKILKYFHYLASGKSAKLSSQNARVLEDRDSIGSLRNKPLGTQIR